MQMKEQRMGGGTAQRMSTCTAKVNVCFLLLQKGLYTGIHLGNGCLVVVVWVLGLFALNKRHRPTCQYLHPHIHAPPPCTEMCTRTCKHACTNLNTQPADCDYARVNYEQKYTLIITTGTHLQGSTLRTPQSNGCLCCQSTLQITTGACQINTGIV